MLATMTLSGITKIVVMLPERVFYFSKPMREILTNRVFWIRDMSLEVIQSIGMLIAPMISLSEFSNLTV